MPIKGFVKGEYQLIEMQKYENVGSEPFYLIGYRDPALFLENGLHVYADAGGTTELTYGHNEDYDYGTLDVLYRTDDFAGKTVLGSLQILNPFYHGKDLWITWNWVADYTSGELFNRLDRAINQMTNSILTTQDANVVVDNNGNLVVQGEKYPGYRGSL